MPSTQKKQHSSKLFKCTGYGDCNMVFTRSEHLARHIRKHTGEKPYPCIVPDCNKSFSRFDNMMQHTQTHQRDFQPFESQQKHSRHLQHKKGPFIYTQPNEKDGKVILHQPSSILNYNQNIINNSGSESPSSLSCASMMDSGSSDDDDDYTCVYKPICYDHDDIHDDWMNHAYRRLSVAEICNPIDQTPSKLDSLTNDEEEVIQAFQQLRQTPDRTKSSP